VNVMLRFLGKEFVEIRRTWRGGTILGVLLFFAVLSPLAALATPALVSSITSSQPGVVIKMPDPTYVDSYAQWIKNLSQIGFLLIVFASAGLIANERASGTAALVVTKPISRHLFAWSKYIAQASLVALATIVGTIVVYVGTTLAFGRVPVGPLVAASSAWLAGALLAIALAEALSAAMPTLAAGIAGLVIWGLVGLVGFWEPAVRYSPVGLLGAPSAFLTGDAPALGVPVLTGLLAVIALVALAGAIFARREL